MLEYRVKYGSKASWLSGMSQRRLVVQHPKESRNTFSKTKVKVWWVDENRNVGVGA